MPSPGTCSVCGYASRITSRSRRDLLLDKDQPGGGSGCRRPGSHDHGAGSLDPGMAQRISWALTILPLQPPRAPPEHLHARWRARRAGWTGFHRTLPRVDTTPEAGASVSDTVRKAPARAHVKPSKIPTAIALKQTSGTLVPGLCFSITLVTSFTSSGRCGTGHCAHHPRVSLVRFFERISFNHGAHAGSFSEAQCVLG